MKQVYVLILWFLVYTNANAQYITFSSAPFKTTVLAASTSNTIAYDINDNPMRIDVNNDGQVSYAEAANVYSLRLGNITPIIYNINGIEHFVNLRWLDISASWVSQINLSALLPNLEVLYCASMGNVSYINISGLNLKILDCDSNPAMAPYFNGTSPFGNISQFTNLETLDCQGIGLTTLDIVGLSNLKSLNCDGNNLTNLNLNGYSNLQILNCVNNQLVNLDLTGCTGLTQLRVKNNKLVNLTVADKPNLTTIGVSTNPFLTNLVATNLPSLQYLNAESCALSNITLSGLIALKSLTCEYNQLTSLDVSGFTNLEYLSCNNNQLTTLDVNSCIKLRDISCQNNNLASLFIKNGLVNSNFIYFTNNPGLQYVCCDENESAFIQALVGSNCNLNTYCTFVPGGNYNIIQGSNKFDNNNNGCDASDLMFRNLRLKLTSNGNTLGYLISNNNGNYSMPLQSGTYTITPQIENSSFFIVTPTNRTLTFTSAVVSPVNQDFCFRPNGIKSDIGVYIFPMQSARPGFEATYKIIYKNKGNKTQSGTVNLTFDDALLDFVLANPVVAVQNQNFLSWNYSNLLPFETRSIDLTLLTNAPTDTPPVSSGTLLAFNVAITDDGADLFPEDNTYSYEQYAVNSFDPNDKTCLEGNNITPEMVGKEVHYLIRFENTGTANAENIVVKDMIDTTKFDINSLIPIDGSHPFETKISNTNKVEFIFENIQLPFDDANNDGYVAFKIKTQPSLVLGNTFSNTASIYFDYNFPIVTNTETTTVALLANQDFAFEDYFKIYPNPANDVLNIETKKAIEVISINIYNTLGQIVLVIPNAQQTKSVDVSGLKTGNYFIKINSDKGNSSLKFVKM